MTDTLSRSEAPAVDADAEDSIYAEPHVERWLVHDCVLFLVAAVAAPWVALAWCARLAGWL